MAQSYSSLNFDGQMHVDANHATNPHYAPSSFTNKFLPDAAEPCIRQPMTMWDENRTSTTTARCPNTNSLASLPSSHDVERERSSAPQQRRRSALEDVYDLIGREEV
ncbi:hypothetical protein ACJ73_04235 [Blastomyces percursus]|uniref:Uncharacterized protein n=1 Tax=Blastomyces percursus TaxID=1658174 RepID=A0A1J9Q7F6_9EURO|nr:hypothetical protein ACJ73_04235 [Blastomyces percursus]